jgi:hypothetical protein
MIKTIKEEHSCCDKIKATIMVKIKKPAQKKLNWMKNCYKVSNITSNDSVSLEIEAKTCSTRKKNQR